MTTAMTQVSRFGFLAKLTARVTRAVAAKGNDGSSSLLFNDVELAKRGLDRDMLVKLYCRGFA